MAKSNQTPFSKRSQQPQKIGHLYLNTDYVFQYTLSDTFGKCVGIISAIGFETKDYIQLDRFCVAKQYRNNTNIHYGRQLLERIISEAKCNPALKRISVVPKGEELFDDIEPMDISELYMIYSKLGFKFDTPTPQSYSNTMYLEL